MIQPSGTEPKWPQFRLGCLFWLATLVAFILAFMGREHRDPGAFNIAIFVAAGVALVIWGAILISPKR